MEERLTKLERELADMKARALGDALLMHALIANIPTSQVEAVVRDFAGLAEWNSVAFIFGPEPETARSAFEAKRASWIGHLQKALMRPR